MFHPHTKDDLAHMLDTIGAASLDDVEPALANCKQVVPVHVLEAIAI